MPQPTRRVVLLGASNLTRAFSTIIETARLMWREPLEIMAAMGHGRSYGQDSRFLGRNIPGIFPCALWHDLRERPRLPTVALITDIGNDLGYGVTAERLLPWVEGCLERLAEVDATSIVTRLPIESLERLGRWRFWFYRSLLFPRNALTLNEITDRVRAVDRRLKSFDGREKVSVIPVSRAWYGIDAIHLKRRVLRTAWPALLAAWRDEEPKELRPRASLARWARLSSLAPAERSVFGFERRCDQPSGRFRDGTTISLY